MGNITSWLKLPTQILKTPRFVSSCTQNPLSRPVLILIQRIITTLDQQKSSLIGKIKTTLKPIGTFLWKSFYSRLCKVLKKTGLLSSFLSTFKDAKIICKAFPPPYEKKQKPLCINLPTIPEESEPLDSVIKTFYFSPQIARSEIIPKHLKEAEVSYLPLPTIQEEPVLSALFEKPTAHKRRTP